MYANEDVLQLNGECYGKTMFCLRFQEGDFMRGLKFSAKRLRSRSLEKPKARGHHFKNLVRCAKTSQKGDSAEHALMF